MGDTSDIMLPDIWIVSLIALMTESLIETLYDASPPLNPPALPSDKSTI